jgi:hypothetical protein
MQTLDERQDGNQQCVGPEIRRDLQGGGVRRLQHESTDCSKRYLEDGHDRLLVAEPSQVVLTQAGSGALTFTNSASGTFSYTVDGIAGSKPITRLPF